MLKKEEQNPKSTKTISQKKHHFNHFHHVGRNMRGWGGGEGEKRRNKVRKKRSNNMLITGR